jgi:probable F420-dependent oxidoreductase
VNRTPIIGVHPTATDRSMPLLELARETEARGLRSLYLPEHTHVPVDTLQITEQWTMAERYQRSLDPYIGSAFVAAQTSLEVGTAISLVAQHDAIALAKAIATIDHLAPGRTVVGIGFGYNLPEAANHGFPPEARATVAEEAVRLMRALWVDEVASFEGTYRRMSPSWSWPKPVTPPPVLLGARPSLRNIRKIVDWADGWIPMGQTPLTVGDDLGEVRRAWDETGRDADLEVCCFFHPGDADAMAREVERGMELGIRRMQVLLEDRTRDEVLPVIDALGLVADKLLAR